MKMITMITNIYKGDNKEMNDDVVFRTIDNIQYIEFDNESAKDCIYHNMKVFAFIDEKLIECKTEEEIDKYGKCLYLCPSKEFEDLTKYIFSLPFDDPDLDINF